MKIVDVWEQNGKTAVYCDDVNDIDTADKKSVFVDHKEYSIIGYDKLTSVSGMKNLMILLDTNDKIPSPAEITII